MEDYKRKQKTSVLLKRFLPYYKRYIGWLVFDLFCAGFTVISELALPVIARHITSVGLETPELLTLQYIGKIAGLYLLLRILDCAANYYMAAGGHIMGTHMETDMRTDLFNHLQTLSFTYYDNTKIGQLMSRITSDLFDIAEFAHHCPEEYFIAAVKIVVAFVVLIRVNVPLTLLLFALIPLMLFFAMRFRVRMRNAFKWQRSELGEINSHVEDSLLGIRVSKSFANEEIEEQRFEEGNERFLLTKKVSYKNMGAFRSVTRLFDGLMYISIVFFGSLALIHKQINAGDFIAYLMYVSVLLESIRRVVEFTENFQRGITGIERFVEIMDTDIEIEDSPGAVEMPDTVRGDIEFDNVSFSYTEAGKDDGSADETLVLNGLSLTIKSGENVALVGPSGAGKTTFCNLIPRFYDVSGGAIRIDGRDIRDYKVRSLRTKIGMMQQEVYLFSDSVAGNIGYGKPGASREEIIEAAKLAGADEFIRELPDGYDTYVGERGARLSGGQKQRISIARVFLKNPPILILDEATSSLDNESEHYVQESLADLAKGRTTITIAHRLSTVRKAGRIIVLTEGGIAEEGTHDELIEKGGSYADLYNLTI